MRSIRKGSAVVTLLGCAAVLSGQTPIQPGQIASASDSASPFADAALARETTIANVQDKHDRTIHRIWVASIFTMAGASGLDAASSWGKQEGNSFLASSNGRFGAKGLALKASFGAAVIVPEFLFRKHKDLLKTFAIGNFAEAALFGGAAIHNLGVASPQK